MTNDTKDLDLALLVATYSEIPDLGRSTKVLTSIRLASVERSSTLLESAVRDQKKINTAQA